MIIFYFGFGPYMSTLGINTFTLAAAALSLSNGAYLARCTAARSVGAPLAVARPRAWASGTARAAPRGHPR